MLLRLAAQRTCGTKFFRETLKARGGQDTLKSGTGERSRNSGSYSVQLASGNREHGVYSEHSGGLSDSPATANCETTREEVANGVGNERLAAVGECFPGPENNFPF